MNQSLWVPLFMLFIFLVNFFLATIAIGKSIIPALEPVPEFVKNLRNNVEVDLDPSLDFGPPLTEVTFSQNLMKVTINL